MFSSRAFFTRFHEYSRKRRLLEERDRVIAAISGGIDSVVLLDLLAREQNVLGLSVIVAHYNFRLRGQESDDDEHFVRQWAQRYGFEVYVERSDTATYARENKLGIQEAARKLRYEFFDNLLLSSGFDKIATAHNADDNAETILLNFFRGAGVAGLAGIPVFARERRVIRPLLFAERREIEQYAAAEKLQYRTDSSNAKDYYTRNFIRHNIVPLIQEGVNPNLVQTLSRSADVFRELEVYLLDAARGSYESVVQHDSTTELHLGVARLRSLPRLMQQYVVMLAAQNVAGCRLEFDSVQRILDLTVGLSGSYVELGNDCLVFRDRERLVFRRAEDATEFRFSVQPNRRYQFDRFCFSSEILEVNPAQLNGQNAEYVDHDRIGDQELILRSWSAGDWFIPLGMKSKKKISDFFVDEKVPIYKKAHIPILETKKGEVVWVCGLRIDDRFKVTPQTRRVMKLQFSTKNTSDGSSSKEDQG